MAQEEALKSFVLGVDLCAKKVFLYLRCLSCLLEINLTNKTDKWLKLNDVVRLEIEGLGKLENKIKLEKSDE